jgi:hypothetical protein
MLHVGASDDDDITPVSGFVHRCKAELLAEAYGSHLKQHVVVTDSATGQKVPIKCKEHEQAFPPVSQQQHGWLVESCSCSLLLLLQCRTQPHLRSHMQRIVYPHFRSPVFK